MMAQAVAKPLGATWVTLQAGRSCPLVWVPAGSPCSFFPLWLSSCPPVCAAEKLLIQQVLPFESAILSFLKLAQRVVVFTYVPGEGGSLGRVSKGVKNSWELSWGG